MPASLNLPEPWQQPFAAVIAREQLPLVLAAAETATVCVVVGAPRAVCTATTLYVGGRLPCAVGRDLAGRLGLTVRQLHAVTDVLGIKVTACEWGCF